MSATAGIGLRAEDVRFAYDPDSGDVLRDVSLEIAPGECVALLGHTGSGKSTLLRLLAGLEPPVRGRVVIDGVATTRARDRRRLFGRVGYAMQRPERQLFAETVRADVAYGPANLGLSGDEVERRVDEVLDYLHISDLAERSPFALSGGQQRLAALAGILAMRPGAVLFDEPLAGLDPAGRELVREAVCRVRDRGATVVMVTHDMNDAASLAGRVCVMNKGRIELDGAPEQVFSDAARLRELGLGQPDALAFARELEARTNVALGSPVDAAALADAIARALSASKGGAR